MFNMTTALIKCTKQQTWSLFVVKICEN